MPAAIVLQKYEAVIFNANGKPEWVKNPNCKATQTTLRLDLLSKDTSEPLAVDIEFQTCKAKDADKWAFRVGRIAVVDTKGNVVYDTFVRYKDEENVAAKANPMFGVTWQDLKIKNGAKWFEEVKEDLQKIMAGRIIVGHGMKHDIAALNSLDADLLKSAAKTVDTQALYGQINLQTLVCRHLGDFDFQWHDPTYDAKATMLLYLLRHPYKGRTALQEKLIFDDEEFPALGATPTKKKR